MFNFLKGHPNPSLLPLEEIQSSVSLLMTEERDKMRCVNNQNGETAKHTTEEESTTITSSHVKSCGLNYGAEAGGEEFLTELASFLRRSTANDDMGQHEDDSAEFEPLAGGASSSSSPNELFITNGVSHGIDLLCSTLTNPGDVVLVERPTYFYITGIFRSHGLLVRPLPMMTPPTETDDDLARNDQTGGGVDVSRLIHLVESQTIPPPKLIYVIPTHQNPTGTTMSIHQRKRLARFVHQRGILLLADDVYHFLDWSFPSAKKPARLSALNECCSLPIMSSSSSPSSSGCCVSVSSFTKIFAPGVRCGWIEGPSHIIAALKRHGYIQSQGGCAPFMGEVLRTAIRSDILRSHLDRLNDAYSQRAKLLCDILKTEPRIQIHCEPSGGYFVWIRFPFHMSSEAFLEFCQRNYDVTFLPGNRCDPFHGNIDVEEWSCGSDVFSSYARLCFAYLDVEDLVEGTKRFVDAFRDYDEMHHHSFGSE